MGFARDHTYACMRNSERRANKQGHEDLRCGLLGNAIQAQLLAHLVAPALKEWGYLTQDFSPSDLLHAVNGAVPSIKGEDMMLARALCTLQTHRGGEIRLRSSPESLAQRPVLQALDAQGWWDWQHVISCAWHCFGEPIAALEARGHLLALRWRLRSVVNLNKRIIHLLDSQTCVGAFVKHRSRASSLNFLCKRAAALELASCCQVIIAYCRSHRNPADEPSRRLLRPRKPVLAESGAEDQ